MKLRPYLISTRLLYKSISLNSVKVLPTVYVNNEISMDGFRLAQEITMVPWANKTDKKWGNIVRAGSSDISERKLLCSFVLLRLRPKSFFWVLFARLYPTSVHFIIYRHIRFILGWRIKLFFFYEVCSNFLCEIN